MKTNQVLIIGGIIAVAVILIVILNEPKEKRTITHTTGGTKGIASDVVRGVMAGITGGGSEIGGIISNLGSLTGGK